MKLIFKLLITFTILAVIAIFCANGPGHVIIFVHNYRIDLSLTSLCISIALLYLVLYTFMKSYAIIHKLFHNLGKKRNK